MREPNAQLRSAEDLDLAPQEREALAQGQCAHVSQSPWQRTDFPPERIHQAASRTGRPRRPDQFCVEQHQGGDLLSLCRQLARHFKSNQPTERVATQKVRPMRLHPANGTQVVGGHILHSILRRAPAIQASGLKPVERPVGPQRLRQMAQVEHIAEHAVHDEQRGKHTSRLDRHQRAPPVGFLLGTQRLGDARDGRVLKEERQRERRAELPFDASHQSRGQ